MSSVVAPFVNLIPPKTPIKKARVLHYLCCGHKINRFDAEKRLNDHALNSTVSELKNDNGVVIARRWIKVPGFQNESTNCVEYSMDLTAKGNLYHCYSLLLSWGYRSLNEPDHDSKNYRNAA